MTIERGDIDDELNPTLDVSEDEEDENAAEEEEEEYTFRFENGMDPLEFVDNNNLSGIQCYQQQFGRLADKKRKALSQSHPEGAYSKKAREDYDYDISGATMAEIMELMNHGVRRRSRELKKRGRQKGSE